MEGVHDDMVWYQMMKAIKQTRIGIKLRNKAEISWAEEMGYHRSTGSFIFLNAEFIPNSFLRTRLKTSPQSSRMGRLISILRLYF